MNKTEKVANERWRRATVRRITALETALRDLRAIHWKTVESEWGVGDLQGVEKDEVERAMSLDEEEVMARVSKLLQ